MPVTLKWPQAFGEAGVRFTAVLDVLAQQTGGRVVAAGRIVPFGDHCRVIDDAYRDEESRERLFVDDPVIRDRILNEALPMIRKAVTSGGAPAIVAAGCGFTERAAWSKRRRGGRSRRPAVVLAAWASLRAEYSGLSDSGAAVELIADYRLPTARTTVRDAIKGARACGYLRGCVLTDEAEEILKADGRLPETIVRT